MAAFYRRWRRRWDAAPALDLYLFLCVCVCVRRRCPFRFRIDLDLVSLSFFFFLFFLKSQTTPQKAETAETADGLRISNGRAGKVRDEDETLRPGSLCSATAPAATLI